MLSDKAVRELRAKVGQLLEIDPMFRKIDQALAERQTLRERNVRYSTELGAAQQEVERLRMVLREHGLMDYQEVPAEPEGEAEARKARIENALMAQARDLGDVEGPEMCARCGGLMPVVGQCPVCSRERANALMAQARDLGDVYVCPSSVIDEWSPRYE